MKIIFLIIFFIYCIQAYDDDRYLKHEVPLRRMNRHLRDDDDHNGHNNHHHGHDNHHNGHGNHHHGHDSHHGSHNHYPGHDNHHGGWDGHGGHNHNNNHHRPKPQHHDKDDDDYDRHRPHHHRPEVHNHYHHDQHRNQPPKICFQKYFPSFRWGRSSQINRGFDTYLKQIRKDVISMLNERRTAVKATNAISNLYARAVTTLSHFMEKQDENSSQLELTEETGRMFTETTEAFAQLLKTVDLFLYPKFQEFDVDLKKAKLQLIEQTRETLTSFLSELYDINEMPVNEKTEEFIYGQELLIEHTKNSYKIVYETSNSILENILKSHFGKTPIKKVLATKILYSAAEHIKAFSYVRMRISSVLLNGELTDNEDLQKFQNDLKHELLDAHSKGDDKDDEDDDDDDDDDDMDEEQEEKVMIEMKEDKMEKNITAVKDDNKVETLVMEHREMMDNSTVLKETKDMKR